MSKLTSTHVGGRWRLVHSRCRCSHCGHMVESTWRWFPRPGLFTNPLCGTCVDELLEGAS